MRLNELRSAVREGLRSLPYHYYLCAMCVICSKFKQMYTDPGHAQGWDLAPEESRELMDRTLVLIKDRVNAADSNQLEGRALEQAGHWEQVAKHFYDDASPGLINVWYVYKLLAYEISGAAPRYVATERVTLPVIDYGHIPDPRGYRKSDPDEELDETTFRVQVLRKFQSLIFNCKQAAEAGLPPTPHDFEFSIFD